MKRPAPLSDEVRLNCTIVSDTHMDVKNPVPWLPKAYLKSALKDSQNNLSPVDAFITVGDTTSRGQKENWELAKDCFSRFTPAKKVLLTVGNHDLWHDGDFPAAIKEYYTYFEAICGRKLDRPYFSDVLNGYRFIFLGNDDESGCAAHIGDEQLAWFKDEMKQGGESGKPIFVFCHQSLNQKHGLPRTWDRHEDPNRPLDEGGIGERSGEIEAILKSYKNVFYFSGHSHMGLGGENCKKNEGYSTVEQEDGLTLINLPCLGGGNHHGETHAMGIGIQLEVYDDRVVLRPRDYRHHRWTGVAMQDGKPYYTVTLGK